MSKKKKRLDSKDQPSGLVVNLFSGSQNPLVTITGTGIHRLDEGRVTRSMGFIVESLDEDLFLVVTCKHVFLQKGYRLIYAMKNPLPTMLTQVGAVIADPLPESDVAFLVLRSPTHIQKKFFSLDRGDIQVKDDSVLYNAKNQCDPFTRMYGVFMARQSCVREHKRFAFCKLSEPKTRFIPKSDVEEQSCLLKQDWLRYRALVMLSRPGNSGSPIWDDELRLYGMNARGSTPEDNPDSGDTLIFIPTSELYQARLRVEDELSKIISSRFFSRG